MSDNELVTWLKDFGPWVGMVGTFLIVVLRLLQKGSTVVWDFVKPLLMGTYTLHKEFVDSAKKSGEENTKLLAESAHQQKIQTQIIKESSERLDKIASCIDRWTEGQSQRIDQNTTDIRDIRTTLESRSVNFPQDQSQNKNSKVP